MFLSALLFWPVRSLARRIRKRSASALPSGAQRSSWLVAAGTLAALASLLSLLCLVIIGLIPNLIYFPWPRPYIDLTWWQFALVGTPFISLGLAVGITLIAGLALRGRSVRWYFLVVALALLIFDVVVQF